MATVEVDAPSRLTIHRAPRIRVRTPSCRVRRRSVARPWGTGHRDQLVIVEAVTERKLAELRSAVIDKPTWTLNGVAPMRFRCSAEDTAMLDCLVDPDSIRNGTAETRLLGYVEAQFWRDGELRWAGPVVADDVDLADGTVEFECWDLGFYLSRRFIGPAERKDLLNSAGQFDRAGLPGWTRVGVTAVRDTAVKARGRGSAKITGSGALTASFEFPATKIGQDQTVLVTMVVRLPSSTPEGTRVASVTAVPVDGTEPYRADEGNAFTTTSSTTLGAFTRITCRAIMKPNRVNRVTVALWSRGPAMWVDDLRAMRNDTTSESGEDLTAAGVAVMNHIQTGRGKAPGFGFGVQVFSLSGTVETFVFRHLLHEDVLDAFDRFVGRGDGWDWWINPQTRKVCFAASRGKVLDSVSLNDRTALAGGWSDDESEKASAVVVLGESDGVDRPEGSYVDTSRTGGYVFERLVPSRSDRPLSELDPTARAEWEQWSQPQTTLKPVTVPGDWWTEHTIGPGDVVPSQMSCGVLRPHAAADGFRIQEIVHDLDADVLELT